MEVICLTCKLDAQLIDQAKNGSNFALAQLLQQKYSTVYHFLLKITLDPQLAADITQDAMIKIIDKFASFDPQKSSLSTWMITIAKNLLKDEYRKISRYRRFADQTKEEISEDPTEKIIRNDEILSNLKNLNEKMRIPIVLKYAEGFQYEEISKMLKIPVGTVKSRIFKGIAILKKEMDRNG